MRFKIAIIFIRIFTYNLKGGGIMANFKNEILVALKEKFVMIKEDATFDSLMSSSQRQFYLEDYNGNIFEDMVPSHEKEYVRGSGSELKLNMRALRSSSAMTYNLLGNNSVTFKPNNIIPEGPYLIEYEKQLRTLKGNGKPANLDAQLLNVEKETVIFCEMKMVEWLFNSPGRLKNAYLAKENYLHDESFTAFNEVFESLIDHSSASSSDNKCIYKRYDAFQMIKHTLGIYNAVKNGEYDKFHEIRLINCVWKSDSSSNLESEIYEKFKKYDIKHLNEFEDFKIKIQPIISLFSSMNVDFDILYLSLNEFLALIDKSSEQLKYLERYSI